MRKGDVEPLLRSVRTEKNTWFLSKLILLLFIELALYQVCQCFYCFLRIFSFGVDMQDITRCSSKLQDA